VLTVEFTVAGIACVGLNGGPAFRHSEAFSFSRSPPTTRPRPTGCGTPSSATVARKANAAGARTAGACPGRSARACCWTASPTPTRPWPSACSRP
jgi:hypothetical protein